MLLSAIKSNKKNPRKISASELDRLKESIRRDPEFMRLRPIVIDEKGTILGGNQRHKAMIELGMKDVPDEWIVKAADLSPEQQKRFILVDNAPQGMAGEWDFDVLQQEWDVPELEELGFDCEEKELSEKQEKELKPYKMAHILISYPPHRHGDIIDAIDQLFSDDEIEIESSAN